MKSFSFNLDLLLTHIQLYPIRLIRDHISHQDYKVLALIIHFHYQNHRFRLNQLITQNSNEQLNPAESKIHMTSANTTFQKNHHPPQVKTHCF